MDRWQIKWFCSFNFNSVFVLKKDVLQKTRKRNSFDLIRSDFYSIIFSFFVYLYSKKKIPLCNSNISKATWGHFHTTSTFAYNLNIPTNHKHAFICYVRCRKKAILNISIYFWRLPIDFRKQWEPFPNLSEVKIVWRDFLQIHVRPWWVYAEEGVLR